MLKTITFIAVLLALLALSACNAQTPEEKADMFVNHAARKFDLNDNQKARLFEVASVALDLRAEMKKDEDQIKQELISMFASSQLDQTRIEQILYEKEKLFQHYSRLLITSIAGFHNSLTAEQRKEIAELLKKKLG